VNVDPQGEAGVRVAEEALHLLRVPAAAKERGRGGVAKGVMADPGLRPETVAALTELPRPARTAAGFSTRRIRFDWSTRLPRSEVNSSSSSPPCRVQSACASSRESGIRRVFPPFGFLTLPR
jgi:hypothetical protein